MSTDDPDGVIAPADHRKVIFKNGTVRVLETTIRAGDITPLHSHLTPTVLQVISGFRFMRRDVHGATMLDARADPGFVTAAGALLGGPSPPRAREHRV
jgi:hypothetical protein